MLIQFNGQNAFTFEEPSGRLTCHYCQRIYYFSSSRISDNFMKKSHNDRQYNEILFRCIECAFKNPNYPFRLESSFNPNDEQREIIITLYQQMIITQSPETLAHSFLVDGSAGTGKTSTIMSLFQYPEFKQFSIVFSAPTNKALNVMMEKFSTPTNDDVDLQQETEIDIKTTNQTFMTLFKLLNGKTSFNVEGKTTFETYCDEHYVFPCNIIVIDEASMIDRNNLDLILKSIGHQSLGIGHERQLVIFLGDVGQLPPVGEETSHVFEIPEVRHLTLHQIMRSHDQLSDFSRNLRHLLGIGSSDPQEGQNYPVTNDVSYLSLKSFIHPPIQYFNDRDRWLQCYAALFKQNLEHKHNRNQGSPIIVCYTNGECDSLNHECRNLIFGFPEETYVRNELLVFQNRYSIRRFKVEHEKDKVSYQVCFFTSEPVLVIDSSQSEITISPLTWKSILESIETFKDHFKQWIRGKISGPQLDYIIIQIESILDHWQLTDNGDLLTPQTSLNCVLNGLIKNVNRLSRRYRIDSIVLDSPEKLDPADISPDPIQITTIANESLDIYTTECDKIKSLIKSLVSLSKQFRLSKYDQLLWGCLIQRVWIKYYRSYVWPFAKITYGYAMTTHKSQGSTYANVFVNIPNILGCRKVNALVRMKSLYTAMTRPSQSIYLLHNSSYLYPLVNETEYFTCQICHCRQQSKHFPIVNHQIDKVCADHLLSNVIPMHLYPRESNVILSDRYRNLYIITKDMVSDYTDINDVYDYIVKHNLLRNELDRYQQSNLQIIQQQHPNHILRTI